MVLKLDIEGVKTFLNWKQESLIIKSKVTEIHNILHKDEELQQKYLGWLNLPLDKNVILDIQKIKKLKKLNPDLEVLVVIGIGGSYVGAKAGIEFCQKPFNKTKPEIIFAGHQVSGSYLYNLIHYLKDKKWAINVISKSGTTLEPSLTFRILKKEIENKYGLTEAKKFIFATTDADKGILLDIAKKEGYETFVIPNSIGGRFSVLTNVGFLPFVFANLDVEAMLEGAKQAYQDSLTDNLDNNLMYQYALARYLMYTKLNKKIELFVSYEPHLLAFAEWWKQLFGESEGKEEKGLFVSSINNSTDLHSLGQFIQEGSRIMFETVLNISIMKDDCHVPIINKDLDQLNYLAGRSFSDINQTILIATKQAHIEGGVPNIEITISHLDEYHLGYLIYFFQKACAMSGYLIEINPFTQPGVEIYKQKMFDLLK
ncbi:MAG: glucose-6-phosphate isomerase [Phytoplasma sp.]|uniref:glucose-6-phosphate isomerase n=1 Tax=Phytoplasma sp. TaxID=2155 RepID=UPI002B406E7D|nr:glucose-6-phosphate isomerase [Phytoplasma sp.]WRH06724.1 MAG: glucose-6-phosphate isomerase [Phytoplasma sp.]